ncbi:hypothetical protein ATN89_18600 [Comamonas thiooxydans]|uniref:hypothetical protein n=1 Tax=Comamonas thiooxydans TaxID=363952 RepID=UPI0007C5001D|nr:hypothetical protein [Comamonas thiooxydans]OAD82590.1 hypothetical protein ATN89_18600 [Comamonas thiooxydans]
MSQTTTNATETTGETQMSREKINAAFQRAEAVVNGFKRVRDQQARDVVAMAGVIAQRDQDIELLRTKVHCLERQKAGLELQLVGAKRAEASARTGQAFGQVFGQR